MKATKSGFTLVEILIVVVILGILAAIVIPQFTEASTEAKTSALVTDLQAMRSQIELYKVQHNDNLPGVPNGTHLGTADFVASMTGYTTIFGVVTTQTDPNGYGPYLQKIPMNQFVDSDYIECAPVAGVDPAVVTDGTQGWYFCEDTGKIWATDSTEHLGL
ncbi:MAG: prepilin-type N-terminal cleavage/methylation domain-containing protein [Planctomycetota bacterium]|jgi:general secretion pathway protein G